MLRHAASAFLHAHPHALTPPLTAARSAPAAVQVMALPRELVALAQELSHLGGEDFSCDARLAEPFVQVCLRASTVASPALSRVGESLLGA